MKALVTYFIAEGTTAKLAKAIAETVGADLYEIKPEVPYTAADIKWTNPLARCNREWLGKKEVPVAGRVENMADYGTLYVGFPIWYGCAPLVVNTFLKGYDLTGKTIKVFATSGGSALGKTVEKLKPYVGGGEIVDAKLLKNENEARDWAK